MKNESKVVNLSNYLDITAYNFGEYNNNYTKKWVDFGKDNDYPVFLRNLYLNSPTHQAICEGTINLATGNGVEVVNPEKNPITNKFLNDNFPQDVVKNLISDLKIYGYCAMRVYSGGKIVEYSEALKYRFGQKGDDGKIKTCWFSNDWDNYNSKNNKPVELPLFNGQDVDLSIIIIQLDKKGFDYYSPVDYNGSINYVTLESEISKYHLSNIKNGLFPSFVINFVGSEYSDEQQDQIEQKINQKFGGSSNTGKAIISFSPTKDDVTQITTIDQPNIDQTYTFLSEESSKKIMIGHGVTTPLLFGIRDSGGGFGNNADELEQGYLLFKKSKLETYQNYILQLINKIINSQYLYSTVIFSPFEPFSKKDTKLSEVKRRTEVETNQLLNKIDSLKIEEGTVLNENIFDGVQKDGYTYKFVKSSNVKDMFLMKMEIETKKGFVFQYDPEIIKNTKDYYFLEQYNIIKK